MKKIIFVSLVAALVVFASSNVWAFNIRKGTHSLGGNLDISYTDYEGRSVFRANFDYGYFFRKNFEAGLGLMFSKYDEGSEIRSYGIEPFLTYHVPVNQKFNVYAGAKLGFYERKEENQYSDDVFMLNSTHETRYFIGKIGIEPKITESAVLDIGLKYYKEIEESSNNYYQMGLGIKLFL